MPDKLIVFLIFNIAPLLGTIGFIIFAIREKTVSKIISKKTYIILQIIISLYLWVAVCSWAHGESPLFGIILPLYLLSQFIPYAYEFQLFIRFPLLLSIVLSALLILILKQKTQKFYPIVTQVFLLISFIIFCEFYSKYEMHKQAKTMDLDCAGIPSSFVDSITQFREFPSAHAVAHKENISYLWSYKKVTFVPLSPQSQKDLWISDAACQNFHLYKKDN